MRIQDIGGHPLKDGNWLREGLVFRISGGLMQDEDLGELDLAGLRLLIDLRGDHEDRSALVDWAGSRDVRYQRRPIDFGDPVEVIESMGEQALTQDGGRSFLTEMYRRILDEFGHQLAGAVTAISATQPTGFGCAAGKDRTGLLTALLQDLVGVERSAVMAGYASQAPDPVRLRQAIGTWKDWEEGQLTSPGLDAVLGAAEDVMAEALDYVDSRYGGTQPYLESAGLPPGTADRLRECLVATAGAPGRVGVTHDRQPRLGVS